MSKTRAETAEELLTLTGTYFKRRGFDRHEDSVRLGEMYRLAVEEGLGEAGPPFWPRPYFKQSTGITREQSDRLLASMSYEQRPYITAETYAKLPDVAAYIAEHGSPLDAPPAERAELERRMDEAMAKHASGYQEKREAHDRAMCDAPVPTMVVNRSDWADTLKGIGELGADIVRGIGGEVTAVPDMGMLQPEDMKGPEVLEDAEPEQE